MNDDFKLDEYGNIMAPQSGTGYWDNLMSNSDMGDFGSMLGGFGKLGSGLFEMYQGNQMMDIYEKNSEANLANHRRQMANTELAYNNQLSRGSKERAKYNGGVDPMKRVG